MGRIVRMAAVAAVLAGAGLTGGSVSAAEAPGNGLLRLAHLSPDTPDVDVYVDAVADPDTGITLEGVGYGAVSDYQDVPPGDYTVSMRQAGADPATPAVLSTTVTVTAGQARTVAGVGLYADLGLEIIDDALETPPQGQARVRVLAGAANAETLDVALADGEVVAEGLAFATTSDYVDVPAGSVLWRLEAPGVAVRAPVDLAPGSVYSLVVLDDAEGLTVTAVLDAAGPGIVPQGGVETGVGGPSGTGSVGLVALGAGAVAVIAAALLARPAPRRPRHAAPRG
jgi:hypothetical protein